MSVVKNKRNLSRLEFYSVASVARQSYVRQKETVLSV